MNCESPRITLLLEDWYYYETTIQINSKQQEPFALVCNIFMSIFYKCRAFIYYQVTKLGSHCCKSTTCLFQEQDGFLHCNLLFDLLTFIFIEALMLKILEKDISMSPMMPLFFSKKTRKHYFVCVENYVWFLFSSAIYFFLSQNLT